VGQRNQLVLAHNAFDASGIDEPLLYHDAERPGFTALFTPGGPRRQLSVRLNELPGVLGEVRNRGGDAYVAQNEFFKPNRRAVNCWRLTSCYVDLDTYKLAGLNGLHAEALGDLLLRHCDDARIPPPSVIVYSGRGLQAKWLLEHPVPRAALPRWQALQDELGSRLEPLGADLRALDASRVLRLVGTVNSRSGEVVRLVHVQRIPTHGASRGAGGVSVYAFDNFFDELLPLTRQELAHERAVLLEKQSLVESTSKGRENPKQTHPVPSRLGQLQLVGAHRLGAARRLIPSVLAWDRLADLRKLAELRHGAGGLPSGQRNLFVFLGACFLASALVTPSFRAEVRELGQEFAPGWSPQELESCISSVHKRLQAASSGERVDFLGRAVDPRYRFRNETLVEWLGITGDEMPQMKAMLSQDESRRRDRDRKQAQRRERGSVLRQEYLDEAQRKQAAARALKAQGQSVTQIAKSLGISRTCASRYCRPS